MALDVDVERAVAEPEFGHEQHVPTVERVVQECHFATGAHPRIDRAELLDHFPTLVAQRRHLGFGVGPLVLPILASPEENGQGD